MKATLIDDLIEKCHYSIQYKLAIDKKDPTNLLDLAKPCQRIEFAIKSLEQNKALYLRNSVWNNRPISQNKIIVDSSGSSAAPVPTNHNPTPCIAQMSLLRAQAAVPLPVPTWLTIAIQPTSRAISAALKTLWLTNKEVSRLKKLRKCYNCKDKGHTAAC